MKVVLATGIYPPDIGGPATYAQELASELSAQGIQTEVVTYGDATESRTESHGEVHVVSRSGGMWRRWKNYAAALKDVAADADIVVAFSSVSCGIPLMLAHVRGPKKILRLGGDFFWERYTDRGGLKGLAEWYSSRPLKKYVMHFILHSFHHITFSTAFQQKIYETHYGHLPPHSVIENALTAATPEQHQKHQPFRLLFMGRFVGFKNLPVLIESMITINDVSLTLVGDGPMKEYLEELVEEKGLADRVAFFPPAHGQMKKQFFHEHDLLVIPSTTEISPNVALEARSHGLPVLLTKDTGLSEELSEGMMLRPTRHPEHLANAIIEAMKQYDMIKVKQAQPRPWSQVANEWTTLFRTLV